MNNDFNFEEMLEDSLNRSDNFETGDKVSGTIIEIGNEYIFVDISGKSEAIIPTAEFQDKDDNITVNKGDSLEAYVVSVSRDEITLTQNIGKGKVSPEILEIAYNNNFSVEGLVKQETKGGYTIMLSETRAFCPYSQIDVKKLSDPNSVIGKKLTFKITKYAEKGRNIVLSRRELLEVEINIKKDVLKSKLKLGDTVSGTISSEKDFGLFVNLDGIEALVPKSEISWSRHSKTSLKIGDNVEAKVIELNWEKNRIALSIKQLAPEPWSTIDKISENDKLDGKVVNIIKSGAFIEIIEGIEGFVHISKLSYTKRINNVEDVLSKGDNVSVKVLSIDKENKRISLELLTTEVDPWSLNDTTQDDKIHTGTVEIVHTGGINIRLENGMLGYIPGKELKAEKGSDLQKTYKVGNKLKVAIIDINTGKRDLILSEVAAINIEEKKEISQYLQTETESSGSSLGALFGDKFKNIKTDIEKK